MKKLLLEHEMVTKSYLKPTYLPTYVTVVTVVLVVIVVTVVKVVTVVSVVTKTLFSTTKKSNKKTYLIKKNHYFFIQLFSLKKSKCDKTQKLKILQD